MKKFKLLYFNLIILFLITITGCSGWSGESAAEGTAARNVEIDRIGGTVDYGEDYTFKIIYENFYGANKQIDLKIQNYDIPPVIFDTEQFSASGSSTYNWNVSTTILSPYFYYDIKATYCKDETGTSTMTVSECFFVDKITNDCSIEITDYNDIYDCNGWLSNSRYFVDINIKIETLPPNDRYAVHCCLIGEEETYYFNYIMYEENSNLPASFDVTLEWGGSLPSGSYTLKAYLQRFNGTNWETEASSDPYDVCVYDYSGEYTLKDIEYDYHPDHDFKNGREDEFHQRLKTAFDPTGMKFTLKTLSGQNILDQETVTKGYFYNYARDNDWDYPADDEDSHILFMGISLDADGTPNYEILGAANCTLDPQKYRYSYIFMDVIEERCKDSEGNLDDRYVYKVIIHELGHQRALLGHASGQDAEKNYHDSPFCVMNQGMTYKGDNDNSAENDGPPQPIWYFYKNPNYCDKCIISLTEATWKGNE